MSFGQEWRGKASWGCLAVADAGICRRCASRHASADGPRIGGAALDRSARRENPRPARRSAEPTSATRDSRDEPQPCRLPRHPDQAKGPRAERHHEHRRHDGANRLSRRHQRDVRRREARSRSTTSLAGSTSLASGQMAVPEHGTGAPTPAPRPFVRRSATRLARSRPSAAAWPQGWRPAALRCRVARCRTRSRRCRFAVTTPGSSKIAASKATGPMVIDPRFSSSRPPEQKPRAAWYDRRTRGRRGSGAGVPYREASFPRIVW